MSNERSNVHVQASPDGQTVVLTATLSSGSPVSAELPAEAAGVLVVELLRAAIDCGRKTGAVAPHFAKERSQSPLQYVPATALALAETDNPDLVGVVFAIGATELGIGVPRAALQRIASALLALTTDATRRQ
jgi:hypothetical protein